MSLDGMTFVITGAARGIGAVTARTAAARGAAVMISDVLDNDGEALAREIRDSGGRAAYRHCDVTEPVQVDALMAAAADEFGGIDVLHNNAGVHESQISSEVTMETMSVETFDRVVAVNLRGPWLCAKAALPYLKASTNPSIINAGSTGSFAGYPNNVAYGSTKGGIALLTKNLAVELAPYGIRVNCYCPAAVSTGMVKAFIDAVEDPEALLRNLISTHLVRRIGDPQDVANLVCFLASKEASFVNGAVWLIDGGSLAWRGTVDILGME